MPLLQEFLKNFNVICKFLTIEIWKTHTKKNTIKATKTLSIEWSKQPINEIIGSPTLALDTGQNFLKGSSKA